MQSQPLKSIRPTTASRRCPLCLHGECYRLLDLHYALFEDTPLASDMHLSSCRNCGFVYYDTESREECFSDFYRGHYFIHAYSSAAHDYQTDRECYGDIVALLREHGLQPSSRIIDVGCGQGQLMRTLQSNGFENVAGVEICQEYVDQLNGEGLEVYSGSAFELPVKKSEADLFIYKHIFEHFYDLRAAAKAACEHLPQGGYLFAAVPDASYYGQYDDYSFLHYLTLEHINHFDLHHVESLFEAYGMKLTNSVTRMLDISEDYPVPILSCLFRKEDGGEPIGIRPNFELAEKMLDWIDVCSDLGTEELEALWESGDEVYVWGVSYRTAMYLAMSPLKDCNIKAFVDIDPRKQGKRVLGKEIVHPDILLKLTGEVTVVVGVGPSSRSMADHLHKIGFKGKIVRLL